MLVISRKKNESIVLCKEDSAGQLTLLAFVILVESYGAKRVRIGMHYNKDIKIFRLELTEFSEMPIEKLTALPIGTPVKLKERTVVT
jgi:sRNA-binding carbon storage regulator CsrA